MDSIIRNNPALELDKVSFGYAESCWQLHDISFSLHSGEILGIIGPNGAGKSTLIKIAAGIISDCKGTVKVYNRNIKELSRRQIARQLAYLPQSVVPVFDYSAMEIVAMGRFAHVSGFGVLSRADYDIIHDAMRLTQTSEYARRNISHLSGGERQRVLLASAMAQQPKVMLLDEPTTGLDLHHQIEFFELIGRLAENTMAVAVVTHDLNLAAEYCTRLILLNRGSLHCQGTAKEVLRESVISQVYGENVTVAENPINGKPMVLPGRGKNQARISS